MAVYLQQFTEHLIMHGYIDDVLQARHDQALSRFVWIRCDNLEDFFHDYFTVSLLVDEFHVR